VDAEAERDVGDCAAESAGAPRSKLRGYLRLPPLSREALRDLDRRAISEFGIPGIVLMENAGEACARRIEDLLDAGATRIAEPFHVVCGSGNNGGDGFVIARHLHNRGYAVEVHLASRPPAPDRAPDAAVNFDIVRRLRLPIHAPSADRAADIRRAASSGTIIDAIFGSGLDRAVEAPYREWIDGLNRSGLPIVAIDIPSGLDADSGRILGGAIRALHTLTFVAAKLGFALADGPGAAGTVHVLGISIPRQLLEDACRGVR
jgi:NAD(P)H-hydrate epimerase